MKRTRSTFAGFSSLGGGYRSNASSLLLTLKSDRLPTSRHSNSLFTTLTTVRYLSMIASRPIPTHTSHQLPKKKRVRTATQPQRGYASFSHDVYSKDLYKILGVSSAATTDEIKSAFFRKAKEYHPDVNKGDPNAQKKFVEISNAYEILRDASKRKMYDAGRAGGAYGAPSWGQPPPGYGQQRPRQQQQRQQSEWNRYSEPAEDYDNRMWHEYQQSRRRQNEQDDFMGWYRSNYHDLFKEFEDMLSQAVRDDMARKGGGGGHWEVIDTPFGRVKRYVFTSRGGGFPGGGFAGGGGGGAGMPMGGMGLFGLLGQLLGGMRRGGAAGAGQGFGSFEDMFHQSSNQFEETLLTFPQSFEAASLLPAVFTRGRVQLSLTGADGEPLGMVQEVGTNILAYHAEGHAPVKAHRTFDVSAGLGADVIRMTISRRGKETLTAVAKEHPPFRLPLLGWLNNFFTKYVVSNERGQEVLLVSRWNVPFMAWMTVKDTKQAVVASARMAFSIFPGLKTRWYFEIPQLSFPVHPSVLALLAGFTTSDKWKGLLRMK